MLDGSFFKIWRITQWVSEPCDRNYNAKKTRTFNMNVLITGGAGYIGSHTCKELARNGYLPVSYDNLVYGHDWAVKWGPLEKGDIADTARLVQIIKKYEIRAVMHFAAFAYVGESVSRPDIYYQNNLSGSISLLTAMKETGVRQIVFSSTCATYGNPLELPIRENHPQNPINPYGFTKYAVERMIRDFGSAFGIRSVCLRYFNAAGADLDCQIGESHDPETHLIPLALAAAFGKRPALAVYGSDYPTRDGTCIRDYIHVTDLASAHVLALKALENDRFLLRAYNLGNGKGVSVQEIIASVEKITRCKVPCVYGERRGGDAAVLIADSSQSRMELGWNPVVTDIDAIIESAARWTKR
jgi:UDP-arabinose 4-epimerase